TNRLSACSSCHPESVAGLRPSTPEPAGSSVLTLKKTACGSARGALAPPPIPDPRRNERAYSHVRPAQPNPDQSKPGGRPLTEQEAAVAKAILTCVGRLNDRFGKGTIARVLAGASSNDISLHGLERTPGFGALRETRLPEINRFIKALRLAGCLE